MSPGLEWVAIRTTTGVHVASMNEPALPGPWSAVDHLPVLSRDGRSLVSFSNNYDAPGFRPHCIDAQALIINGQVDAGAVFDDGRVAMVSERRVLAETAEGTLREIWHGNAIHLYAAGTTLSWQERHVIYAAERDGEPREFRRAPPDAIYHRLDPSGNTLVIARAGRIFALYDAHAGMPLFEVPTPEPHSRFMDMALATHGPLTVAFDNGVYCFNGRCWRRITQAGAWDLSWAGEELRFLMQDGDVFRLYTVRPLIGG